MSIPLSVAEKDVRDRRPFFSEFLLTEFCVWLLLGGVLVTLAIVWPAEVGQKADLLKPAPEGIKPEWYFLFMFKTLKLVPETLGVALFALGALFLAALPFVDRKALRGQRSRGVTAAFVLLLLYVAVFETLALMDPGGHQPAEELIAETYSLSGNLGILIPLWGVIGGLIFYLRLLAAENRRVRRLYPASDDVP